MNLSRIYTDRGIGLQLPQPFSLLPRMFHEIFFKFEYYYNYGMPQWLAKIDYLLKPLHIERMFLGRHKFHHFRVWYRDELSDYVREILLDRMTLTRPYLHGSAIEKIVNGHVRGSSNYTSEITKLLSIELMERILIEGQG